MLYNEVLLGKSFHVLSEKGAFAGHANNERPKAVVGQDSRASGEFLEAAVVAGLASAGVDVYRVGVLPTPAIAHLVAETGADLGVMISASHNPAKDNGIKFFARSGMKLDDGVEAQIEAVLGERWNRPDGVPVGKEINDERAREEYISYLLGTIEARFDGLKIVLDCANGAASFVAPEVLRRAGAEAGRRRRPRARRLAEHECDCDEREPADHGELAMLRAPAAHPGGQVAGLTER